MQVPKLTTGGNHEDKRGRICYNNDFDASEIKRIYTISNNNPDFIRAWQGHKIERRWFSAVEGSFQIKLIEIDDWSSPSKNLRQYHFLLSADNLDVLAVPAGYISSIQGIEEKSKLLVMADYMIGEVKDEYRFEDAYFSEN